MKKMTIGFLGAGNMAEALMRGLLAAKISSPRNLHASDIRPERLTFLRRRLGIRTHKENLTVVRSASTLVLAVKPQALESLSQVMKSALTPNHLLISIAAGVPLDTLRRWFGSEPRMVRVMPNTPALVGAGATAILAQDSVKKQDLRVVRKLFQAVGQTFLIRHEEDFHAITALSGSGPAYVFYFLEGLIAAGVGLGLEEKLANELALQTLFGSAKLLVESRESPKTLREKVTSPKGTTEAGVKVLTEQGMNESVKEALNQASKRSRELASGGGS